ncbi:MAG: hypothetical protein P8J32_00560 [bacterium]|jgi:hypothetical protein|nr:hypothetical protein [bacterium]
MKLKDWQLAVLISAIVVVITLVITQRSGGDDIPMPEPHLIEESVILEDEEVSEEAEIVEEEPVTQAACEAAGGEWDMCASPCEGLGGGACITVCVQKCRL